MERNFVYEVAGSEDVRFRSLLIRKDKPLASNVRIPALEVAVKEGLLKCNYVVEGMTQADVIAPPAVNADVEGSDKDSNENTQESEKLDGADSPEENTEEGSEPEAPAPDEKTEESTEDTDKSDKEVDSDSPSPTTNEGE